VTADLKDIVIRLLTRIAPEAQGQTLAPDVGLREQLDLDSMDALNFMIALHQEFHIDIPESDYSKLITLDGIVAYLGARLSRSV
jgi:acyl carrier protein